MSSFSMTVTSGAFPSNTASDFCMQLPHSIVLESDMEVALLYIQTPAKIHNVPRGQNSVTYVVDGGEPTVKILQPACYTDFFSFFNAVKKLFPPDIKVTTDNLTKQTTFQVPARTRLSVSYPISRLLGFTKAVDIVGPTAFISESEYNLLGDNQTLFVYSSLVKGQIVDSQTVPLLAAVPAKSVTDGLCYEPTHRAYRPVAAQEIDRINFEICNIRGERVPFIDGYVCLTLHFRKNHHLQ